MNIDFELEWLGDSARISNVALLDYYNTYSCKYTLIGDLNDKKGNVINVVEPAGTGKGTINVVIKSGPFPEYIRVETVDDGGNIKSFYEPVFKSYTRRYATTEHEEEEELARPGCDYDMYKMSGTYGGSETYSYRTGANCMNNQTKNRGYGTYRFDLDKIGTLDHESYYFRLKSNEIRFSSSVYEYNDECKKELLPLPDIPIKQLTIKRTWDYRGEAFFESVGYDVNQLPTWDIILQVGGN